MSTVVDPFIKRLQKIEDDIPKIFKGILIENKDEILDFIRNYQLGLGLDSFGNDLVHPSKRDNTERVPLYEPSTENYWAKKSPQPRTPKTANKRYGFEWTGGTFDGLYFKEFKKDTFSIFSKDKKANELEQIYGTKLFDLTEEHNEYINNEILYPKFIEYLLEESVRGLI